MEPTLEQPKPTDPFLNMDLNQLPWRAESSDFSKYRTRTALQEFTDGQATYQLRATETTSSYGIDYRIEVRQGDTTLITATLEITHMRDSWTAMTSIAKDPNCKLRALTLDKRLLDLLQSVATRKKQAIKHGVYRAATDITLHGQQPLPPEKWQKVFAPMLTERGYTELAPGEWEKVYQPER